MENKTYDEIRIGDSASLMRTLTQEDLELFAAISGDTNPVLLDPELAKESQFHRVVGHGMWGGSLISSVLGTKLPGPGTIYLSQDLKFVRPVTLGDTITVTVTAQSKQDEHHTVTFACVCRNQDGKDVITGTAEVIAPKHKVIHDDITLPEVKLNHHTGYQRMMAMCASLRPVRTAVVHPCDHDSLMGAIEAARAGMIEPILIGPESKILSVAAAESVDLTPYRIVSTEHSHAAAETAVAMARAGEVEAIMKGSLHTDELMHEVARRDIGLRTDRRISHIFVMDVESYPRTLLITDAAINITPSLDEKRDIVQNAIDLAHALGIELPKVAILAAVETVNSKMPSTLDAAALCKMADRGQITGAVLDGPLAFDNAVSPEAARTKKIVSPVAGQADILLVPDLEAGNMLAKQLSLLAGADSAGIVLGARVPIILTSRADNVRTRMASCAVALLFAEARRVKLSAKGA